MKKRLLVAAILLAGAALASDSARLVYSKSFPGSTPPYVEIAVERSGNSTYQEDPKDDDPVKFQLSEAECDALFRLADTVSTIDRPLETRLKVANMGMKMFRLSGDSGTKEFRFNYSENADAQALVDWFERISETERSFIQLERAVRFDKLGVQDAILRVEVIRDQKRLVAEKQFLPLLDRVAKNEGFLHIARDRAGALADSIRAAK